MPEEETAACGLVRYWSGNADFASGVVSRLPYPSLGRLATTSKAMKSLITKTDIEKALQRGKELFGKVEVVLQYPFDSFHGSGIGSCVRILDINETALEIGRKDTTSNRVTVRWGGRVYTGRSYLYKGCALIHFLEDSVMLCSSSSSGEQEEDNNKENFGIWFEVISALEIRVKFCGNHWTANPTRSNPAEFSVRLQYDDWVPFFG